MEVNVVIYDYCVAHWLVMLGNDEIFKTVTRFSASQMHNNWISFRFFVKSFELSSKRSTINLSINSNKKNLATKKNPLNLLQKCNNDVQIKLTRKEHLKAHLTIIMPMSELLFPSCRYKLIQNRSINYTN